MIIRGSVLFITCTLAIVGMTLSSCIEHRSRFEDEPVNSVDDLVRDDTSQLDPYKGEDRFHWQRPDFVIDQLGDLSNKVVADLGAGSGYFSFRLVKKAKKLIAIDIDPSMIALLEDEKSYYNDEIQSRFESRLATPSDPKLKNNEVDIILMVNTYPYIEYRINYFTRLRECLKPGGLLMIVDFKKRNLPIGPDKELKVAITTVEDELAQAGYTRMVSDDYSLAYQYIVKAYKD